jgi:low affinity Fe/Cu permease
MPGQASSSPGRATMRLATQDRSISQASIVTFLVAFLIQYAQNLDTRTIRLKLDELLRATEGARPDLADLDRFSDKQIERLEQQLHGWRQQMPD